VVIVLQDLLGSCQGMKTLKTRDDHQWHGVRSNFDENWFVRESFERTHNVDTKTPGNGSNMLLSYL
jgi:hypothetical protein